MATNHCWVPFFSPFFFTILYPSWPHVLLTLHLLDLSDRYILVKFRSHISSKSPTKVVSTSQRSCQGTEYLDILSVGDGKLGHLVMVATVRSLSFTIFPLWLAICWVILWDYVNVFSNAFNPVAFTFTDDSCLNHYYNGGNRILMFQFHHSFCFYYLNSFIKKSFSLMYLFFLCIIYIFM